MRVQPRCVELLRSRCRRESDRAKANTPRRRHRRLLRRLKGYLTGAAVDCLPRGQDRAVRSRGCVPMSPVPLGDLPGVAGGWHQRVDSRRDVEIAGSWAVCVINLVDDQRRRRPAAERWSVAEECTWQQLLWQTEQLRGWMRRAAGESARCELLWSISVRRRSS